MKYCIMLPDKLSLEQKNIFYTQLFEFIDNSEVEVVIDCSKCQFIDSTILNTLVSAYKRGMETGVNFKLCSVNNPNVLKVFELTRLDKVFNIETTSDPNARDFAEF